MKTPRTGARSGPVPAGRKPPRSFGWALSITLLGWVVLATPVLAVGAVAYLLFSSAAGDANGAGLILQGILCVALLLCMVAAPLLLGTAAMLRRRGWWIAGTVTGVLSLATLIYISYLYFGAPTVSG